MHVRLARLLRRSDRKGAETAYRRALELAPESRVIREELAAVLGTGGSEPDLDEALRILERVYESRDNIWFAAELFRPGFDSLLDDPRFQALLDRMNVERRPPVWTRDATNEDDGG